jgi:hypothetical protein
MQQHSCSEQSLGGDEQSCFQTAFVAGLGNLCQDQHVSIAARLHINIHQSRSTEPTSPLPACLLTFSERAGAGVAASVDCTVVMLHDGIFWSNISRQKESKNGGVNADFV